MSHDTRERDADPVSGVRCETATSDHEREHTSTRRWRCDHAIGRICEMVFTHAMTDARAICLPILFFHLHRTVGAAVV